VEAGRGKSVGGAAAIVGMLQCFGCGCLALIRRACNKKTNPGRGFGIVIWTAFSIYEYNDVQFSCAFEKKKTW